MLKAVTENDELVNVKATKDGKLMVETSGEGGTTGNNEVKVNNEDSAPIPVKVLSGVTTPTEIEVNNTSENAVPVSIQGQEVETTLNASIQTVGTEATSIAINKKVTSVDIANYSDEADLTVTIGTLVATIGANISATLPINKDVTNISLTSTVADTKAQLIVKGVEA